MGNVRENKSGSAFFGPKTLEYLKKKSRTSVEDHTNTQVLYFEIDPEKSKRNFYGEMLVKKFVNPLGILVNGVIEINEGGDVVVEGVPNKITVMNFSCYIDHLKELNINPKLGDYFATKNRIYLIHDKTILDANSVSVGTDREAVSIRFAAVQSDDEQLFPGIFGPDGGTKNDITKDTQF